MKRTAVLLQRGSRRGSLLLVTLGLIVLISVGALLMGRTVIDHQKQNERRRELWSAFLLAESGISLVQHWAANPSDYTDDTTLFDPADHYANLLAAIAADDDGVTITHSDLAGMGVGNFTSSYNKPIGEVEEIKLLPYSYDPNADPDDPDADPELLPAPDFKIRCVGRTWDGLERNVIAYATRNPTNNISLALPAALLSLNTASGDGNAKIHWGEAWSKHTFDMMNKSDMNYLSSDSYAKYRTESTFSFPSNWKIGIGKDLYDLTRDQPGLAPASGTYANSFYQHATGLQWPDFASQYQDFKDIAIANGRYYSTDASGNVYRGGIEDSAHRVSDLLNELGVADRSGVPEDIIFIDTIDGNPPAANGSNVASVSVSGNSLGLEGVYYFCVNFDATGVGSPPSVIGIDPDGGSHTLQKIFLDGVLYTAGTVAMGGNSGVYGSVVAEKGYAAGGTPDIYYNVDLADGIDLAGGGTVGSPFKIILHTNFGG